MTTELIMEDQQIQCATQCLKAISHPLRIKILCLLLNNALSVQDIVKQVGTTQSNISQHLAVLRNEGILAFRKNANHVIYYIKDQRTLRLIDMINEIFVPAKRG